MSNTICRQFGTRLRVLRKKREWSQEDFAFRVGMDVSYLSELEGGKSEPCLRLIQRIAKGFGVSISEFMDGIG